MKPEAHPFTHYPHRRKNILAGEWVLVSPHRTERPWQGEVSAPESNRRLAYDPQCYLCPGNKRANGQTNPHYESTYVFTNDFSALVENTPRHHENHEGLLSARTEKGICRVVNFSPRHDLTLAEMKERDIEQVIAAWQEEYRTLGARPDINFVQIFENKGAMMGNSNPHPHGQVWAQENIPGEAKKELTQFKQYYRIKKRSLLSDYLKAELKLGERVVFDNASFVVVVPYWASWPFETLVIAKRRIQHILQFTREESADFSNALSTLTIKYDNVFKTSFPYSAGLHQAPTDGKKHPEWHFHMHFYPPLLRSASVRKFMVGYEMLAEPQRDVTPEWSAGVLRSMSSKHYSIHTKG